jgi:hypothetical protein
VGHTAPGGVGRNARTALPAGEQSVPEERITGNGGSDVVDQPQAARARFVALSRTLFR